jgi:hypothetical protein
MAVPSVFGVGTSTYGDKSKDQGDSSLPAFQEEPAKEGEELPKFDPTKEYKEEGPSFDPKKGFMETTEGNYTAANILEDMGLHITDEGIRSKAQQQRYYNSSSGVAEPGTSPHESANAIDIRIPNHMSPDEIVQDLEEAGFRGVTVITKRHGTGPHWHVQWDSKE